MKKTDQEIEKMLLNDLEETIVMGWADTSEKVLLLELIRERQVKNNIVLPDVSGQLPDFLYEDNGEIKIGYHADTVVTDEWNKWKEGNFR